MSKRAKKEKRPVAKIDFKPYGAAIKAGRTKQKESRNKAADALFISPRYLANIENKGQHPSVQVFLELMSRYHISVDQILHGETMGRQENVRADNTTLSGVVAVFAVILAVQLFAGTIGGRSNRRLTFTAFRLGYCEVE